MQTLKYLQGLKANALKESLSLSSSDAPGAANEDQHGGQPVTAKKSFRVMSNSHCRSKAPRGMIVGVSIGLTNPSHTERVSSAEVTESITTYDKKGVPRPHSLFDGSLGTTDPSFECISCAGSVESCFGHSGHHVFKIPLYHVSYLPGTVLVHRCVCHGCSRCLLDEDDPRMIKIMSIKDGIKRLAKLAAVCQTIDYCGGQPPTPTTAGDNGLTPKQMRQFAKNPNKLARGCGAAQRVSTA